MTGHEQVMLHGVPDFLIVGLLDCWTPATLTPHDS